MDYLQIRSHSGARAGIAVFFIALIAVLIVGGLPPARLQAEGSRDVIQDNEGYRAFLEWHATAAVGGIPRQTTIQAYARAGEEIRIGSSAMGLGQGNVLFRGPDGSSGDCRSLAQSLPPAQRAAYGLIANRSQEVNGGFVPCVISVGAANTGVWEFDFISPDPTAPITNNPTPTLVTANWTQPNNRYWTAAWDVGVYGAGAEITGRVFTNYLAFNMGANVNTTNLSNIGFNGTFYILTVDGYGYTIDMNGIDPFGFIFFSNSEGIVDARGNSIYRSLQLVGTPPNVDLPAGYRIHNPNDPDNIGLNDVTHKIFFDEPAADLPTAASSPSGNTWLLNEPVEPPTPTNPSFTGVEGTPNQAGTAPLGGYFEFDAPGDLGYRLIIDLNGDSIFGNANDRLINGRTFGGRNQVYWDALDGNGAPVGAGVLNYNAQLELFVGEVHFPFSDAENNRNGFILTRVRDRGDPGAPDPTLIYYNDAYTYQAGDAYDYSPCGVNDSPPPPSDVVITPPVCYGVALGPRQALLGVSSAAGGHAWTYSPTQLTREGLGDRRVIDTWTYYPSTPVSISGQLTLAEADLGITKDHAPATLVPGEQITYTVVVTNDGPSAAIGAQVYDDVPDQVVDVSWTCQVTGGGSCGDAAGTGNIINTTVDLNDQASATFTIVGSLRPDAAGELSNIAIVRRPLDNTDPDLSNNIARDRAPILEVADLELTKTLLTTPPLRAGDTVSFQIDLRNRGPASTGDVSVSEQLPAGLTFSSATPSKGSYDQATGIWTVGDMLRNEVATLTISAVWNGSPVSNTAEVLTSRTRDPDSTPGNRVPGEDDTGRVSLPTAIADLELTKQVNVSRVTVGQQVAFTIELLNRGPDTATGVRVSDRLPAGMAYVADTPSQGSYDPISGTWTVGTLANGARATLTIEAIVRAPGRLVNIAQVSSSDQFDPDSTPNDDDPNADDQDFATVEADQADLSLTKRVDNPQPDIGDTIVYTIEIDNAGPDRATGVTVEDRLPAGLRFISATASQGSYDPTTGIWSVGALNVSASAALEIAAEVLTGAPLVNTAQVNSSDQFDPDSTPGNDSPDEDDQSSAALTPRLADLSLVKTLTSPAPTVGGQADFQITLTNAGPNRATNVAVRDQLPAELLFISATPSQGSYDPTTGIWAVGDLDIGASVTLDVRARVVGAGPVLNTAEVARSDQFDPDSTPGNNNPGEDDQSSAGFTPAIADLSVSKRANAARPATDGSLTYTIGVHNAGPAPATGVSLLEQLPAAATFVSATPSQGSFDQATGIWTVGSLPVDGRATLTIQVDVDLTQPPPYTNVARVETSDQYDPDSTPGNNNPGEDDQASVSVPSNIADLRIAKRALPLPGLSDGVLYIITLTNDGPDDATGVVVEENLPSELGFVSAAPSQGAYDPATGLWTVGGLPSGASVTLQISAAVLADGDITNVAQVARSDQFDPDSTPGNNNPGEDDQAQATINRVTSVALVSFTARQTEAGAVVSWETGAELGSLGFLLYRSADGRRASAVQVTPELILSRGGTGQGASYSFLDEGATPGAIYTYWLVEVERGGARNEYGPATTAPALSGGLKVFLPLVRR